MAFFGLFGKEKKEDLNKGLEKTKEGFFSKLAKTIAGKSTVDDEVLDNLEDALVSSDVGVETTVKIIKNIEARVARDKYLSSSELERILREEVELIMKQASAPATADDYQLPAGSRPHVIMVVGVNGVGKTTTIGKMAHQFKAKGYKFMLGAADTFRAAAVDQLTIWSDRAGVEIVKQGQGADPAAVAFDAVQSAKARGADVCIIDTAGRLHNKVGLMNELSKIKRVMQKVVPDAPHEVLLVLDASTGQNAIEQAKQFTAATEVTAIALTKLDGTAKGGVVIGIADQFKIPVKYIGVGEKMHQLQLFDSAEFIDSLFDKTGFKI
ncbi:MAG: signal recognition particle-docking protein FtsY [Bacteroidota bacterium]